MRSTVVRGGQVAVDPGALAANVFKMGSVDGINVETIVIATLGAILVIVVARHVTGRGQLGTRAS